MGEAESFRRYIESQPPPRLSVEYRDRPWPIEQVFCKWFRCEIVLGTGLPIDIGLTDDDTPGELSVRAGGALEYKLLVSPSWFHQLSRGHKHDNEAKLAGLACAVIRPSRVRSVSGRSKIGLIRQSAMTGYEWPGP